ncbi:ABC transporter substrate-binding protein [Paracoccus sp. N5]|uniref:ABC transporter substrate-binding protein n=1 Tax=Paracoccus sp. N5 TaxID=1101189 RepID=UPI0003753A43|nr:ABC transporter substrate-binding protein [Paracoccus sp. N5]
MSKCFLAALALAGTAMLAPPEARAEEVLKIGALLIDSGPLAGFYEGQVRALELAETDLNETRAPDAPRIEIRRATYAGTPETALQAASRLVKEDGVQVITGMMPSSTSIILAARAEAMNVAVLDGFAQAASLTGEHCRKNYFHIATTDQLVLSAYDQMIAEQGPISWDILAADYTTGRNASESFQKMAAAHGGSIGHVAYAPLGTSDFGTSITQLAASPSKGLFISTFGSDAINFAKQQRQFKLDKKYDIILGHSYITRTTLGGQADNVVGNYQTFGWLADFPTEDSRKFADRYMDKFHEIPDYVAADQYVAVQAAQAAAQKAGSLQAADIASALSGLTFQSLLGELSIRAEDHQLLRPVVISQVVMTDGKPDLAVRTIVPWQKVAGNPNPECKLGSSS